MHTIYNIYNIYSRMWRKTRSRNPGHSCRGTDPNRNWGYNWGLKGASTNPCDGEGYIHPSSVDYFSSYFPETYRGSQAFSEPETRAVRDFIMARRSDIKLYLTFHRCVDSRYLDIYVDSRYLDI